MRVFLSYSSADRQIVEPVYFALRAQGHTVFFDRADLPAGEEYDARIRRAIEKSQLFVFMVSPESLKAGSYTLTELAIAKNTWPHPAGRVLPVVLRRVDLASVPAYLKAVTFLEPEGNLAAGVADAVHRLARERHQVRLRRGAQALTVVALIVGGIYIYSGARRPPAPVRDPAPQGAGKQDESMVMIAPGSFSMGDNEESPQREVYLDGFYIDKFEVTVADYARFLEATRGVRAPEGWEQAGAADGALPVIGVDWHDAQAYCAWAGKRLLTEAEWERAARGAAGRPYPWGGDEPSPVHANFAKSAARPYQGGLAPAGAASMGKTPEGVYDLAGNAAEWVADWYAEGFARGDVRNPKGPASGTAKVIRGGGWTDPAPRLKSTRRMYASPDSRADDVGFRCARELRP